jgi:hypothetical protein
MIASLNAGELAVFRNFQLTCSVEYHLEYEIPNRKNDKRAEEEEDGAGLYHHNYSACDCTESLSRLLAREKPWIRPGHGATAAKRDSTHSPLVPLL